MEALLDSNVAVAAMVELHIHHRDSFELVGLAPSMEFGMGPHSYAEAYSTLTRRSGSGCGFAPPGAWSAIERLREVVALVGLTAQQTYDAIGRYSGESGIGPRLYDYLIGEVARVHKIPVIITWNVAHFDTLFRDLHVLSPRDFLRRRWR